MPRPELLQLETPVYAGLSQAVPGPFHLMRRPPSTSPVQRIGAAGPLLLNTKGRLLLTSHPDGAAPVGGRFASGHAAAPSFRPARPSPARYGARSTASTAKPESVVAAPLVLDTVRATSTYLLAQPMHLSSCTQILQKQGNAQWNTHPSNDSVPTTWIVMPAGFDPLATQETEDWL